MTRATNNSSPGHQTLRTRAFDQVRCCRCRRPPDIARPSPARHALLVVEVLGGRLRLRRYFESEPLPRHPRDLAQSRLQVAAGQQAVRHLCQPAHWPPL